MGYHKKEIPKGVLGEFSKIREEFLELEDAADQGAELLQLCEMADLIGAIEAYAANYNISIGALIQMKDATRSAFLEGKR